MTQDSLGGKFSGAPGYGSSGFGPPPADPGQLAGQDVEYRLGREFRQPALSRLIVSVILTAVLASRLATSAYPIAYFLGSISAAVAVWSAGAYLWHGRLRARVTPRGIEMRGYFNHFVALRHVRGPSELRDSRRSR
jgi:hypothetical protein